MSELHDLVAVIRANTPLIVIETRGEARVVELFRQALTQCWRALHRRAITGAFGGSPSTAKTRHTSRRTPATPSRTLPAHAHRPAAAMQEGQPRGRRRQRAAAPPHTCAACSAPPPGTTSASFRLALEATIACARSAVAGTRHALDAASLR